ncbi:MAG: hypothetical protein EYC69_00105 [Bacteroidetes bacterium]|nr:MAG: hypothetical protein EYC69_00105 [Bacteroidota bacterium]
MLFSKINLQTELIRERKAQQELLGEVHQILHDSRLRDEEILRRLKGASGEENFNDGLSEEDKARVFKLTEIKNLCIRYRLRFLDTVHFKSDYPYAAIAEINAFEKKYATKIERFYIAAPDHTFNLENVNKDPLLFAALGKGDYYLIHQWGKDLAWHKKITLWPLQSFKNCFIALWILSAAFSFLIPSSIMQINNVEAEIYLRLWLTVHVFIALMGFTVWTGFTFNKTVSNKNWNSKYYND